MLLEDWLSLTVVALLAVLHVSGIHRLQLQTWFVQEGLRLFCWMLVCSGLLTALRRARAMLCAGSARRGSTDGRCLPAA